MNGEHTERLASAIQGSTPYVRAATPAIVAPTSPPQNPYGRDSPEAPSISCAQSAEPISVPHQMIAAALWIIVVFVVLSNRRAALTASGAEKVRHLRGIERRVEQDPARSASVGA